MLPSPQVKYAWSAVVEGTNTTWAPWSPAAAALKTLIAPGPLSVANKARHVITLTATIVGMPEEFAATARVTVEARAAQLTASVTGPSDYTVAAEGAVVLSAAASVDPDGEYMGLTPGHRCHLIGLTRSLLPNHRMHCSLVERCSVFGA